MVTVVFVVMTRKKGKPRQRTANAIQQMKLFIHGLDTLYYVASIKYPLLDLHPDIMRTVTKEVEQGLSRAQLYGQLQKPLCFEDMKIIRDSILEDMTIYLQREIHQALPLSVSARYIIISAAKTYFDRGLKAFRMTPNEYMAYSSRSVSVQRRLPALIIVNANSRRRSLELILK